MLLLFLSRGFNPFALAELMYYMKMPLKRLIIKSENPFFLGSHDRHDGLRFLLVPAGLTFPCEGRPLRAAGAIRLYAHLYLPYAFAGAGIATYNTA